MAPAPLRSWFGKDPPSPDRQGVGALFGLWLLCDLLQQGLDLAFLILGGIPHPRRLQLLYGGGFIPLTRSAFA